MHEMVDFFLHLKYINNDNFYLSDKMKFKGPTMMFSLIALGVILVSGFAFQEGAFAQLAKQGMAVTVTANEGSSKILVSGETSKVTPIAIKVTAPNGNFIALAQVSPDANGKFSTEFNVGGSLWKFDGVYTITTQHGENTLYTIALPVEVVGGKTLATNVSEDFLENIVFSGSTISQDAGLIIEVDAPLGGTWIGVSGHTKRTNMDVTIIVTEPTFGNIIHTDQVSPDANGDFMAEINVGGNQWKQNGFYTISASQGGALFTDSAEVEVVDGAVIPEFGAIAALILAVAIISIIVVSAKTRLSLIPRY
ncbi:MAG TPA: PEFG-CTERM sorting domain-containing protein [Nitrosopumilus sp.]|nr:PEFG-CTERM sorting domain-containing protein [Nitrosopumilus sp.]